MKLHSIVYKQFENQPNEWGFEIKNLPKINLIVGKNAAGKSRVLNVINALCNMLSREKKLRYSSGDYKLSFVNQGKEIKYNLKYEGNLIQKEELVENAQTNLIRDDKGSGKIYSNEMKKLIGFKIPLNEFAVSAKRDEFQHPFLEQLNKWSEYTVLYRFGTSLGKETIAPTNSSQEKKIGVDRKNTEIAILKYMDGINTLGEEFANHIKADMKTIGYDIEQISISFAEHIKIESPIDIRPNCFLIKEKGIGSPFTQFDMSQGMFRAFSLIIQLNYTILLKENDFQNTVLIDDIGEGLDFDRASLLVDLLLDRANNHDIQLIMTTNDRFIMNAVPLIYWTVIDRTGSHLEFYNYENSKKLFQKFELTGLSNFDMFSSKYFLKK